MTQAPTQRKRPVAWAITPVALILIGIGTSVIAAETVGPGVMRITNYGGNGPANRHSITYDKKTDVAGGGASYTGVTDSNCVPPHTNGPNDDPAGPNQPSQHGGEEELTITTGPESPADSGHYPITSCTATVGGQTIPACGPTGPTPCSWCCEQILNSGSYVDSSDDVITPTGGVTRDQIKGTVH